MHYPTPLFVNTSQALAVYHEYHEIDEDKESTKKMLLASPVRQTGCTIRTDERKNGRGSCGAMSLLMPPKQRFPMIVRVRRQGGSKPWVTSNRDWEFFISTKKAEMVNKLAQ